MLSYSLVWVQDVIDSDDCNGYIHGFIIGNPKDDSDEKLIGLYRYDYAHI